MTYADDMKWIYWTFCIFQVQIKILAKDAKVYFDYVKESSHFTLYAIGIKLFLYYKVAFDKNLNLL